MNLRGVDEVDEVEEGLLENVARVLRKKIVDDDEKERMIKEGKLEMFPEFEQSEKMKGKKSLEEKKVKMKDLNLFKKKEKKRRKKKKFKTNQKSLNDGILSIFNKKRTKGKKKDEEKKNLDDSHFDHLNGKPCYSDD